MALATGFLWLTDFPCSFHDQLLGQMTNPESNIPPTLPIIPAYSDDPLPKASLRRFTPHSYPTPTQPPPTGSMKRGVGGGQRSGCSTGAVDITWNPFFGYNKTNPPSTSCLYLPPRPPSMLSPTPLPILDQQMHTGLQHRSMTLSAP